MYVAKTCLLNDSETLTEMIGLLSSWFHRLNLQHRCHNRRRDQPQKSSPSLRIHILSIYDLCIRRIVRFPGNA